MADTDVIRRFVFDGSNVRGVHVHLSGAWRAVLERGSYATAVQALLGEAVAAASLLAATIKMDGALTLQTRGDGPLTMLVVQATAARTVRGMASVRAPLVRSDFAALLGAGHLGITIDPGTGSERYQGIVSLQGDSLAEVLEGYFRNSEQLPTRLWLAADGEQAAGLLLQQLPSAEPDADAWAHCTTLADTLRSEELLALPAEALLRRLYHAEPVRLFAPDAMRFYCRCSRQRVSEMLRAMPREELLEAAAGAGGELAVDCEFCNAHYGFDAVDIERLYLDEPPLATPRQRH